MLFQTLKFDLVRTDELRQLAWQGKELTKEEYRKTSAQTFPLVDKILSLAKAEKDWYLYFDAMYYMLYMQKELGSAKKVIQYAEIFYRDSQKYFDDALPNYPGTDMAETYTFSHGSIFETYQGFYQIDDKKMDSFMEQYERASEKYGGKGTYGLSLLQLGLLYQDRDMARRGLEIYEKSNAKGCYVCEHRGVIGWYLLAGEPDEAVKLIEDLIAKNIPADRRWCYQHCRCASAGVLYQAFLNDCLSLGRVDVFRQYLPRYMEAAAGDPDLERENTRGSYLRAVAGDFSFLDSDLEQMKTDRKEKQTYTTMGEIYDSLCWYAYLTLLNRSGVKAVPFDVSDPTLPPEDAAGMRDTLELAAWFEGIADDLGMKFEQSRNKFHYAALKKSYQDCARLQPGAPYLF